MAIKRWTEYLPNKVDRDVQKHLFEAYQLIICSNGRYSDPDYHTPVWKEFNSFAKRLFNNKVKRER